ncbi:MAG: ATP-binding cassette domain-containing protein [Halocynthiibacter sp.]
MLKLENVVLQKGTFSLSAEVAFAKGSKTAIIGPSGAGKSTFLDGVSGFLPVASGQISWDGREITGLKPSDRPMSILFQSHNLFAHLSIWDNVALGLRPNMRLSEEEREKVSSVLMQVGLAGFELRKPGEVSGGQQSRAALARILVQDRPIVLLDEPFSALGPALKSEMLSLVETLIGVQKTLLMVTHDPEDAREICDHVLFVDEGRASEVLPVAALNSAEHVKLAQYLGRNA